MVEKHSWALVMIVRPILCAVMGVVVAVAVAMAIMMMMTMMVVDLAEGGAGGAGGAGGTGGLFVGDVIAAVLMTISCPSCLLSCLSDMDKMAKHKAQTNKQLIGKDQNKSESHYLSQESHSASIVWTPKSRSVVYARSQMTGWRGTLCRMPKRGRTPAARKKIRGKPLESWLGREWRGRSPNKP